MKKVFFVVALIVALSLPVFAQEFPDTPPDHWAYDAVQELANVGIIQGYPDGTFGGKRAMTRYEFAEAVAKAIPVIREMVTSGGGVGPVGPAGVAGPAGPAGAGAEEIAALRKLVDEFRDELAALGVDVEALRRDVAALNERVTALEAEVARVRFTGEANLIAFGEVENNAPAFDRDGRRLAAASTGTANANNPLANSSVLTDLDFGMKAKISDDINVNALINTGDYLSFAIGGVDDFTLANLYMDGAVKLGPLGAAQVVAGRFPFQLTPLTLKFVDPDSYTNVTILDNGDFILDGARASFNLGKVALTAFAAKSDPFPGSLMNPALLLNAGLSVDQLAGARAVIGTPWNGNLGLTYFQTSQGSTVGRAQIMGADINAVFGSVGVAVEYGQSDPNDTLEVAGISAIAGKTIDDENTAWNAKLSWQPGKLGLGLGYTTIQGNYFAPGSWSRLGRAVNLRNVKGAVADASYALSSNLSLVAEGQFLSPDTDTVNSFVTGSQATSPGVSAGVSASDLDKITYLRAGVKYALTSANTVDFGWEQVNWEPNSGAETKERYISLGLGHTFNSNASMKLLYQIVAYDQGIAAMTPYGVAGDYRGGKAAAQLQLKY